MKKSIKDLLQKLEKTRHKYWNISTETGKFLNLLIKDRNYKCVLEIGTSNGYSGIWMAQALSQTKGRLYTIESHQKERFQLAAKNFAKSGLTKHIIQIAGHAPEAIPAFPKKFDLIFFDATKEEHLDYFAALKLRIKKGGLILTDNIHSHAKELAAFKKAIQKTKNFSSIELGLGSGLLLSLKIK